MRWGFNPRANCACAYHASFKEISKSEPVPSRVPFKLGLGMACALQTSKSMIFLIEALRELTSLSLVIIHAMGPPSAELRLCLTRKPQGNLEVWAWALQNSKSIIFLIEALRELRSLSLVQASMKLTSLSLGPPELHLSLAWAHP